MRSLTSPLVLALFVAAGLAAGAAACGDRTGSAGGPRGPGADPAAGLTAFETVRAVLQHPRCANCHPAGDAPLQGDEGRVHNQNVLRGPTGSGMAGAECTTCHGPANPPASYGRHTPPGVAIGWHMPPPEMKMVFVGASPRQLCESVRDPARNGGKDVAALREHAKDPLVLWGWQPGFGRAPVSTPYPQFVSAWETWLSAGMPCPP